MIVLGQIRRKIKSIGPITVKTNTQIKEVRNEMLII